MTRRKMLWAGSVALLVAVAGVGTMSWRSNNAEPQLDCQIVRELIEYNSAKCSSKIRRRWPMTPTVSQV